MGPRVGFGVGLIGVYLHGWIQLSDDVPSPPKVPGACVPSFLIGLRMGLRPSGSRVCENGCLPRAELAAAARLCRELVCMRGIFRTFLKNSCFCLRDNYTLLA